MAKTITTEQKIINTIKALSLYTSKDQARYNIHDRFWVKNHQDYIALGSTDGHRLFYQKIFPSNEVYNFFNNLLIKAGGSEGADECFVANLKTALKLKELEDIERLLIIRKEHNSIDFTRVIPNSSTLDPKIIAEEIFPTLNQAFMMDCIKTMQLLGVTNFDTRNIFINSNVKFTINCNTCVIIMPIKQ
jgi:hypothetical protein